MDKYLPLTKWLQECNSDPVSLSFSEIEGIIGSRLPESAFRHNAWWANTRSHPNAVAWMNAGYFSSDCSEIISRKRVNFSKHHI